MEVLELRSKERQDGANRLIWVIGLCQGVDESHINVARLSQICDESWPEGSTTGRKEDRDEDCHVIRQIDLEGTWKGDHDEKEAGDSEKGVRNQTMGESNLLGG